MSACTRAERPMPEVLHGVARQAAAGWSSTAKGKVIYETHSMFPLARFYDVLPFIPFPSMVPFHPSFLHPTIRFRPGTSQGQNNPIPPRQSSLGPVMGGWLAAFWQPSGRVRDECHWSGACGGTANDQSAAGLARGVQYNKTFPQQALI